MKTLLLKGNIFDYPLECNEEKNQTIILMRTTVSTILLRKDWLLVMGIGVRVMLKTFDNFPIQTQAE